MRNFVKLSALALGATLLVSQAAQAVQTWALVTFPLPASNSSRLYTYDSATPGTFAFVGETGLPANTGAPFPAGLEFDPGGTLYAATAQATNFLTTVSTVNGAATSPRGSGLLAGQTLTDLSWDPVGNRMLGLGSSGVAGTNPNLYSIALATGVATNLGAITPGGAFTMDGLDVSMGVRADGQIFIHGVVSDRWYSVNPNTLVATQLGLEGFDSNFGQGGTFDLGTGTLYHAAFNGTAFLGQLYTVNQITGVGTLVGTLGTNVGNPVQVTDIAIRIPEPASLSLVGLSGLALIRRRRA
jgi:hypothetical protein